MNLTIAQRKKLRELKNPAQSMQRTLIDKLGLAKGDKPTDKELLDLIIPLIPDPIEGPKGEPGKNYVLTREDKQEIAATIKVPIVEKEVIIEKTEVIKEQPIVTEIVREVALTDKAEQVRDKLESLKKGNKLSIQSIEDLVDILEELKKWRGEVGTFMNMGGGGGFTSPVYNFVDDETPTGTVNGSNSVFNIRSTPYPGSLKVYVNGQRMRVTEDYTLSNHQKTITFTIAPPTTSIILIDYRTN